MGTHLSGKAGHVYATITGTTTTLAVLVAGMKSWSLDYVADALETTDFADSGRRTYIVGLSGWSGSFEGYKDGVPLTLVSNALLELRETTTTTQKWTGAAIITGLHESVSVDGVVTMAYDFQGTGILNPPTG